MVVPSSFPSHTSVGAAIPLLRENILKDSNRKQRERFHSYFPKLLKSLRSKKLFQFKELSSICSLLPLFIHWATAIAVFVGPHTTVLLTWGLPCWAWLTEPVLKASQGRGAAPWHHVRPLPFCVCGKRSQDGGSSISTYLDHKWLLGCVKAAWLLFGRLYGAFWWTYSVQVNYTAVLCLDLFDVSGPRCKPVPARCPLWGDVFLLWLWPCSAGGRGMGGCSELNNILARTVYRGIEHPETWPVWAWFCSGNSSSLNVVRWFPVPCYELALLPALWKTPQQGQMFDSVLLNFSSGVFKSENTPDLKYLKPLGWTHLNPAQNESLGYWGNCPESSRWEEDWRITG